MKTSLKRVPGLRKIVRLIKGRPAQLPSRERLLAKMPKESICAEIGVHEGDFSEEILSQVSPARLHLIDPWKYVKTAEYQDAWYGGKAVEAQATLDGRFESVNRRFNTKITRGQVQLHRGYSQDVVDQFTDGYFDWIYIDGNHLYEYVKKDLELYNPKVKVGGFITGDDYGVEGWWSNGVQKAVDEFAEGRPDLSVEVIGNQFIITKVS